MKFKVTCYRVMIWLTVGGMALQFAGCNTTVRTAAEDGIITASNSFLASFLQALIQVATEANTASTGG